MHSVCMGAGTFSLDQLGELTAEFKSRFGPDHSVALMHDVDYGYMISTSEQGDSSQTLINAVKLPIAEAVFKYSKAIAAHTYSAITDGITFKHKNRIKSEFGAAIGIASDEDRDLITNFLFIIASDTGAMARHEHAADYARFEFVKFTNLQDLAKDMPRTMSILARAYVKVAADMHRVDVDANKITAGMDLDYDELAVLRQAKSLLRDVHRQGKRGRTIDMGVGAARLAKTVRIQLA